MIKCFTVLLLSSNILIGSEKDYSNNFDTALELIAIQNETDSTTYNNEILGYAYGCYDTLSSQRHLVFYNMAEQEVREYFDEKYFK